MARPQLALSILALILSSSGALGFSPRPGRQTTTTKTARAMATGGSDDGDKVAGSFFNPIPERDDDGGDGKSPQPPATEGGASAGASSAGGGDEFDSSLAELMRRRKAKPRAATPSTVGGVPTSQATGFGKKIAATKIKTARTSTKESFIGIGKPLNDVNNPEYDDQGYTLYADEETGKKSRVFEALVEYPCDFTMKIVGANEGGFESDIVRVVAESCGVEAEDVPNTVRRNGKWSSVTVQAPVQSAEMLYALYENIDQDPRVKFKF